MRNLERVTFPKGTRGLIAEVQHFAFGDATNGGESFNTNVIVVCDPRFPLLEDVFADEYPVYTIGQRMGHNVLYYSDVVSLYRDALDSDYYPSWGNKRSKAQQKNRATHGPMFGGNKATCDHPAWVELLGTEPVNIHDRFETKNQYRRMSK